MPKSSNQKLKLIYLAKIFMEKTDETHGITMPEIIAELAAYDVKAERKSIYDDIEALNVAGLDIEKEVIGSKTVYYLAGRDFELPELKLLVDAVQSSKFITKKKSEALIRKISGLVSMHDAKKLARQVYVSNRIKTMNESVYYTVDDIHSAISSDKQIEFQYFKWNHKGERELRRDGKIYKVSPWALTWDDENYYLVAYDAEAGIIKHYRVDKMVKISVADEPREGAEHFKNFDMALYAKKTFGMYNGKDEQVTLRCTYAMADPIIDRFGQDVIIRDVSAEVNVGVGNADFGAGSFEVTVKVAVSPVFLTWVMNFGGEMKIVSPAHVVEQQIALARKTLAQYE